MIIHIAYEDAVVLAQALDRLLVKAEERFGAPMVNELSEEELSALDHWKKG